jgi:hypothetical protein
MTGSGEASMPKAYLLQHARLKESGEEDVKLLGIYSSRGGADAAVLRFRARPGFAQAPDGFSIDEYTMDQDYWEEGYVG